MRILVAFLALVTLAACNGDRRPPPIYNPPASNVGRDQPFTGWVIEHPTPGRSLGNVPFTIPLSQTQSVNYVNRPIADLSGVHRVTLKVRFEGVAHAKNGNPAVLSLYLQRLGDNWDCAAHASYRFYSLHTLLLTPGDLTLSSELVSGHWKNCIGQHHQDGFAGLLSQPGRIGFVLGDPTTGNTGHGILGSGSLTVQKFTPQ